jgi:hypothetical protein
MALIVLLYWRLETGLTPNDERVVVAESVDSRSGNFTLLGA